MQKPTIVFLAGLAVCCVICGVLFGKLFGTPIYPWVTFVGALVLAAAAFDFLHRRRPASLLAQGHLIPFGARQVIWWGGFAICLIWFYIAGSPRG